jgi:hypothetical protein
VHAQARGSMQHVQQQQQVGTQQHQVWVGRRRGAGAAD